MAPVLVNIGKKVVSFEFQGVIIMNEKSGCK